MIELTPNTLGSGSKPRARARRIQLTLLSGLVVGSTGCFSIVEDRCDAIVKCEELNEKGEDACVSETEAALDVADAYGCLELAEAFLDCEVLNHRCNNDNYSVASGACSEPRQELNQCLAEGSDRGPGPYDPPSL